MSKDIILKFLHNLDKLVLFTDPTNAWYFVSSWEIPELKNLLSIWLNHNFGLVFQNRGIFTETREIPDDGDVDADTNSSSDNDILKRKTSGSPMKKHNLYFIFYKTFLFTQKWKSNNDKFFYKIIL